MAAEQTISKTSIMTYRLTYRRVKADDIQQISQDQIPLLSLPTRVGIPNFSYIRNKRDNDLESTKGNYTTIDGGVASTYFASETDFGRLLIQNSTYHAIGKNRERKFVLARSTRIGVEIPFGRTLCLSPEKNATRLARAAACLPLAERFFSGGGNSHRGFGLNQAGPRDPTTGFPLGGTALFINNIELRTPPPTLPFFQDNMSFAIFHDAGNMFTNGHDMFHNLLHWSQKDPPALLAASHRETMRLQLHFARHRRRGAVQDSGGPGALRFRVQFESARVPELVSPAHARAADLSGRQFRSSAREPFQRFFQHWTDFLMRNRSFHLRLDSWRFSRWLLLQLRGSD